MSDFTHDLSRSRLFFLGLIGAVVAVLLFLNRDALWTHPAQVKPGPAAPYTGVDATTRVEDVCFALFDTETTGVDPFIDRLVELAVVRIRAGDVIDSRTWLINPERFIPEEARAVHGITPEMVADKPLFGDVCMEFLAFVDGCVLMAHNASFDVRFLQSEFERAHITPPAIPVLDSLRLFRSWHPDLQSYSLEALTEHLDIDMTMFHRAEADAAVIGAILFHSAKDLKKSPTVEDLFRDSGGAIQL